MTKQLWIPPASREEFVCRMPVGPDEICGHVCFSDLELARHLKRCLSEHEGDMHAARLENRIPMLDHPDPELEAHMRAVGRRMLAEGRWRVLKSERAGFS